MQIQRNIVSALVADALVAGRVAAQRAGACGTCVYYCIYYDYAKIILCNYNYMSLVTATTASYFNRALQEGEDPYFQ